MAHVEAGDMAMVLCAQEIEFLDALYVAGAVMPELPNELHPTT